jgi:hypothetical protein
MTNLTTTIDAFGDLKADIAELELKLQGMKDALAELSKGAYEGERYRLNVIDAEVERVDWKAVAAKLEPSHQLVAAHTTKTVQRSYRVGARTGKKVAA